MRRAKRTSQRERNLHAPLNLRTAVRGVSVRRRPDSFLATDGGCGWKNADRRKLRKIILKKNNEMKREMRIGILKNGRMKKKMEINKRKSLMYQSNPRTPSSPSRGQTPGHFTLKKKKWSNSRLCLEFYSQMPYRVGASQSIKFPMLYICR